MRIVDVNPPFVLYRYLHTSYGLKKYDIFLSDTPCKKGSGFHMKGRRCHKCQDILVLPSHNSGSTLFFIILRAQLSKLGLPIDGVIDLGAYSGLGKCPKVSHHPNIGDIYIYIYIYIQILDLVMSKYWGYFISNRYLIWWCETNPQNGTFTKPYY